MMSSTVSNFLPFRDIFILEKIEHQQEIGQVNREVMKDRN
jgi:hypothetical protein